MRSRNWLCPALLLALAPLALQAGPAERTRWSLGLFTWVHRVPAEAGAAPNAHPAQLEPEVLQALLLPIRTREEGKDIALFSKDELKDLSKALSEALALARPGEDLILVSTSRHGASFLEREQGLTARLFVRDGALQLIVHDARLNFMDRYILENVEPSFTYGSRKEASKVALEAPKATRLRPDWLALPLPAAPAQVAAPAPTPAPAPAPAPAPVAVPAVAAAPAPAAPPKAAPAPAPAAQDPSEAQVQRLRTLKRLRDENLISEEEYKERREAILKSL